MTYGYLGIGICARCVKPNFLFVSSEDSPHTDPRCARCQDYYNETPVDLSMYPIINDYDTCKACGRPEFFMESLPETSTNQRWGFIEAYLSDMETSVVVHADCTTLGRGSETCTDCDMVYVTSSNRMWNTAGVVVSSTLLTYFTSIEGDNRCVSCTSNHYQENGGEHSFSSCPECDDIFHNDNGQWFSDRLFCSYCHDNHVYTCDNCSEQVWSDNDHDCIEDEEDDSAIHSYSYRPTPFFFGKGQYHLGFELEVEARNTSRYEGAGMVQDMLGSHAYMKDDGSLNDGFEVVTHPHTLSDYQTDFNWDFIPKLQREGFRSWNTDTCGLHVHVSRTAFGSGESPWGRADRDAIILKRQAHELRFMKLIYDNQRQVERIAGRSGNHYATFQDRGKLVAKVKYGNSENGRYSAINTENDATLEVRVFKGSLRKERVLSALEFVTASVEYTRDLKITSKNQALSWLRFTAYISDNLETYPNLALIMSESFASDATPNEN